MNAIARVLCVSLALVACGETAADPTPPVVPPTPTPTEPTLPPVEPPVAPPADPDVPPPPAPSRADELALSAGIRDFSASTFRALAVPEAQSAAIAPASIAGALAMTSAGARGATSAEVMAALGIDELGNRGPAVVAGALGALEGEELAIANRIFASASLSVEPAYVEQTRTLFGSPIETTDFSAGDAARTRINGWVDGVTHHRISEILPAGAIDASTDIVLVNAMYFLASWETTFEESRTTDDFFRAPGGRVTCRMMHRSGEARIGNADGAVVLSLPYAGDRFVATFVMPEDETASLASLEATMTGAHIGHWLEAPQGADRVNVDIPRFRVESAQPMSLKSVLEAQGVRALFSSSADLSGIAPPARGPLYVSDVFHRVFVETTERGTEAAAATAVVGLRGLARPEEPRTFRADRPFLFFVTAPNSHLVLFMARIATPGSPGE